MLQMAKFHSFLWLSSIALYVYTTFSVDVYYSSVDGR